MKNYLLILFISITFCQCIYSQKEAPEIITINKIKEDINTNISNYNKTVLENDTSGYSYVYKNDKELKLISIDYKDRREQGKYTDKKVEWYFKNGHLIYTEQKWTDIATNKVIDNEKFYLNEEHLIAWIKSDN